MQIQKINNQMPSSKKEISKGINNAQYTSFKAADPAEIYKLTFNKTLSLLNGNFKKATTTTFENLKTIYEKEFGLLVKGKYNDPSFINPNTIHHKNGHITFKTSPESKPISVMFNTTRHNCYLEYDDPNIIDPVSRNIRYSC